MNTIKVKCPAKINLTLEVVNKREDGFHNIKSIMQMISLYDYLTISLKDAKSLKINLSGTSDEIPYDERNLVYKAIVKFLQKVNIENIKVEVYIEKNIPVCAGLAGGSTNAAGAFFAMNKLFDNILSVDEIEELCASMGSDLNFCLNGGCRLCTSRGEITQELPFVETDISIIKPKKLGISAKEAYTKFASLQDKTNPDNTTKLARLLMENKFDKSLIYNSLEKALFPDYEQLREIKIKVKNSLLSGSGPSFFVLESSLNANFDEKEYDIFENLKTISTGVLEV